MLNAVLLAPAATWSRTTEIATVLACSPCVQALDIMVRTQKRLLLVLLRRDVIGALLAPYAVALATPREALLVLLGLLFAACPAWAKHDWRAHPCRQELVRAICKGDGQPRQVGESVLVGR